jgi:hypothetical protein
MRYPEAAAAWSRVAISPCGVRGMSSPDGDPFFEELQGVYDEIGEALPLGSALPRPQELDDERADIEASGLFDVVEVRQYDWEAVYDAEGYIDLLNTFSGHIAMADWQRERLYGEIRRSSHHEPTVSCVDTGVASSTSRV